MSFPRLGRNEQGDCSVSRIMWIREIFVGEIINHKFYTNMSQWTDSLTDFNLLDCIWHRVLNNESIQGLAF